MIKLTEIPTKIVPDYERILVLVQDKPIYVKADFNKTSLYNCAKFKRQAVSIKKVSVVGSSALEDCWEIKLKG